MKFSFSEPALPKSGTIVVPVLQESTLDTAGQDLDKRTGGMLTRAMSAGRFTGKREETLAVIAPAGFDGDGVERILLIGLGKADQVDDLAAAAAGGAIVAALGKSATEAHVWLQDLPGIPLGLSQLAAEIAFGARLRSYRFDKYRTTEKPEQKPVLDQVNLLCPDAVGARTRFDRLDKVADAVFLTRDLVAEPANVINPVTLAERCRTLAELGLTVEVLDEKRMKALGMGALLGVAQGSATPPRLVVMRHDGNPDATDKRPVAFIGKGVTFDSGGISIKPAGGMEDMKMDMAGAGAVIGLMAALAGRKAKVNALGVVGLVENMPSGTAQRPGDIVTSLSGQTIEILNTDAEGRLVLADALWYTQDTYKPSAMIDLATLTGAIVVSLGNEYAGLFSNNDELADRLIQAGRKAGEPVWRMPLGEGYDKDINSDLADMKNIGSPGTAGSITAAQFLQRFVNGVPWAHIDIAGTAWSKKDAAVVPKGGTGYGVRLLDRFVADHFEG